MASFITDEYIKEILSNVALVYNFAEWTYSRYEFENIGQNYFGVLVPVVLIGKINGEEVNKPLVLKLAPTDERYRVSGAVTLMFAREIFVYSTVLEQYRTQTVTTQYVIPTCLYMSKQYCREAIVLADMTAEGYTPYTQMMFLDFDHLLVSLKSLAKLHGHSFILKKQNVQLYEKAAEICCPLTEKSNTRYIDVMEDRLNKGRQKFENTDYEKLFQILKRDLVKLVEATSDSAEQVCICHGDMWKENILFKYEDGKPVLACLIDYQTARMSSPAFDVLYLIASSSDMSLRREHFHDLLDIYYEEFDKTLKAADLEPQEIYTKKSFEKDLKTVAPACFIVANTALWLANGLQQEGHVRSKQFFSTEEDKEIAGETYKTIIKSIVDDFCSYNYFCLS